LMSGFAIGNDNMTWFLSRHDKNQVGIFFHFCKPHPVFDNPITQQIRNHIMSNVVQLTDENFENEVLESDVPVLVDFWAPWCGPCRQLTPLIEEMAGEADGKFKVTKLNTDEAPQTATKFRISSIPTLMIFKSGDVVNTMIGVQSKQAIEQAIEAAG